MHQPNSQKAEILKHLRSIDPATGETRGITPYEAIGLFRCFRLAARIDELRDDGHKITTYIKTDTTGKKYAKYYLTSNQLAYREGTVHSLPRNRRG